jgi:hypothetical protein
MGNGAIDVVPIDPSKAGSMLTKQSSFTNWMPEVAPVDEADAGSVTIDNCGPFAAGSYQRFTLTYTVGRYGIDDTGALKICYRFASDMGRPQFTDPSAPNWVGVTASNGAVLDVRFDYKQNTRPWDRTIYIKVVAGFMREGDTIVARFGTDERGPGIRMQTFVDPEFCFRVLADPVATYTFVEVPDVPRMPIIPGPAHRWHAVIPTCRAVGDGFALNIRADDIWGNPTHDVDVRRLVLEGSGPIGGLPASVMIPPNATSLTVEGLTAETSGRISISICDADKTVLARSNALAVAEQLALRPYWGDLHAQSGETIGSGSALDYMKFARDCAFLDMVGHQGNDFQITQEFWSRLNSLMRTWNEPGRFITVPGYEWSGNTALGGDRNVFYRDENQLIRRSSHALVADRSDVETDCWDARALFAALGPEFSNTVVWAHCGGRYADIHYAHDHALERSVEIHSSWGTFEWLAEDAFKAGYRVGIVGNSDGHKGRPGAEPPGASLFGALGGLTCYWMKELTRDALFDAMHARHHYATTGSRVHLRAQALLGEPATVWTDDPRVTGARSHQSDQVIMGDIVSPAPERIEFTAEIVANAPILSIELRRGGELIEMIRPNSHLPLGRRYRIEWSGAEYRGRARQTVWDGSLKVTGAEILSAEPINFFNPDRPLKRISKDELSWSSITTGNFSGVDLLVSSSEATIEITTPHGALTERLSDLDHAPSVKNFGKLRRELRISRQPEQYAVSRFVLKRQIALAAGDNPIWICATFADGHQAWSSPIYFVRAPDDISGE